MISNPKFHIKNVKAVIKCCHALSPYGTNTQQSIIRPLHFLDIKFSIFVASQSFNHRGNHENSGLTQWSIAGVMLKRHWLQFQTFYNSFGLSILIKCSPKVHGNHFVLKCQICKVFVSVGAEIVQSFMHFLCVFMVQNEIDQL